MMPYDASGKNGVALKLPDVITIHEPKVEEPLVQPHHSNAAHATSAVVYCCIQPIWFSPPYATKVLAFHEHYLTLSHIRLALPSKATLRTSVPSPSRSPPLLRSDDYLLYLLPFFSLVALLGLCHDPQRKCADFLGNPGLVGCRPCFCFFSFF